MPFGLLGGIEHRVFRCVSQTVCFKKLGTSRCVSVSDSGGDSSCDWVVSIGCDSEQPVARIRDYVEEWPAVSQVLGTPDDCIFSLTGLSRVQVSGDNQAFEVYDHVSSDSYTLADPKQDWEWRRNKYNGPQK